MSNFIIIYTILNNQRICEVSEIVFCDRGKTVICKLYISCILLNRILRNKQNCTYPGSDVPLQRKISEEGEEREPRMTGSKLFQMIGPIKLSHSTSVESGLIGGFGEHHKQITLKHAGCFHNQKCCFMQMWEIKIFYRIVLSCMWT